MIASAKFTVRSLSTSLVAIASNGRRGGRASPLVGPDPGDRQARSPGTSLARRPQCRPARRRHPCRIGSGGLGRRTVTSRGARRSRT